MKRSAQQQLVNPLPYKKRNIGPTRPNYQNAPRRNPVTLTQELKYQDTAFNTDATSTGAIISLSNVAAGDTALTRDGNKIAVRSFELRVRLEAEATTQNSVIRFLLVRDKNSNNAAIASIASVLDSASPESLRLIANLSRYDILMDKTITLNQTSGTGGAVQKGFLKKYIKVRDNQVTSFADGASGVPITNSYSLIYFSDVATGIVDTNVFGQCRMRFVG